MTLYDRDGRPLVCQECGQTWQWQHEPEHRLYVCAHGRQAAVRLRAGMAREADVGRAEEHGVEVAV